MSARLLAIVMLLIAASVLSGCTTPAEVKQAADDGGDAMDNASVMMDAAYAASAANATSDQTASSNTTSTTNGTSSANETQYDYSNCMRGMDMQGCPADVAERYFNERAANAPPPDKALPNVVIELDLQGTQGPGVFTVDAGTMQLLVTFHLNSTGDAYATVGAPAVESARVEFEGPEGTETVKLGNDGVEAGTSAMGGLTRTTMAILKMPAPGDWTVRVVGQALNVQVEIQLVERFYM